LLSGVEGASLKVYGRMFDIDKLHGVAVDGRNFGKTISPAFVSCIDCTVLNVSIAMLYLFSADVTEQI
jgi:hypothetical protein